MFFLSFKASKIKKLALFVLCAAVAVAAIVLLPNAGEGLNVNKIDGQKELSKINAGKESGRIDYLSTLGYSIKKEPVGTVSETLPKEFDVVLDKYNALQRAQGYDLSKYLGKKVTGYTYEVSSLPDGTKFSPGDYLATVIVYKNKVVAADLVCTSTGEYMPLVSAI